MLLAQLTDLHVCPVGVAANRVVETNTLVERALRMVSRMRPVPDAVILSGDLAENGLVAEYEVLVGLRNRYPVATVWETQQAGVFGKKILQCIADLAIDHDLLVVSDEIYEKIIYDREHISIGSFDGMQERTITVNGFSKAYAMTGWRLGYLTAPPEIFKLLLKIQSHSVSSATTFVHMEGLKLSGTTGRS